MKVCRSSPAHAILCNVQRMLNAATAPTACVVDVGANLATAAWCAALGPVSIWKITPFLGFPIFTQAGLAFELRPLLHRFVARCARCLHFSAQACTSCNCRSPAQPHGWPGVEYCFHRSWVCTKNARKARRREGDKCFSFAFFIPEQIFLLGLSQASSGISSDTGGNPRSSECTVCAYSIMFGG